MAASPIRDTTVRHAIGLAYDCALAPARWPELLASLAGLLDCHFADRFSRTADFSRYGGMAHGLGRHDYQDLFLDSWVKRNAWSQRSPSRRSGEILSTREMMPREELMREPMFNEFLDQRDLHEGLRLVVWAGDGWISDLSFLRAWSAGPFTAAERRAAGTLLPHIQRAFEIERRLRPAIALPAGFDAVPQPMFLLDGSARLRRVNAAGEALLAAGDGLKRMDGRLVTADPAATPALHHAVASAADPRLGPPGLLRQDRGPLRAGLDIRLMPLRDEAQWVFLPEPLVLALAFEAPRENGSGLALRYGLTRSEAVLAAQMLAGLSVSEIADSTGRSRSTLRTHLKRLMEKTGTHRQSDLIRCMLTSAGG